MKLADKLLLSVGLFSVVAIPALILHLTGQFKFFVIVYYVGLGAVSALLPLVWGGLARWQKARSRPARQMEVLSGLGVAAADDGLVEQYPEYADTIETITAAIEHDCEIRFRYHKDSGDNSRRIARPSYIHEHRRHARHEPVLCVSAFYDKRQKNIDFAISRMSDIEILEE